jgi:hypothetical protein
MCRVFFFSTENMQRDAYAALVKYPKTRKVPVRIMQLNGRVFHENLTAHAFVGYEKRRLALMTYTAGQDPRLPRLSRDVIVRTYEAFQKIHQPHFMYQLLPLLTADVEAFAAMQSICSASGSPFTIQDRVDTMLLNYRFGHLSSSRDQICEFFKDDTDPSELLMPTATRRLPIACISFQGILFRERLPLANHPAPALSVSSGNDNTLQSPSYIHGGSGAVFVTTHDVCSDTIIHHRALMSRLFNSRLYPQLAGATALTTLIHSSTHKWDVMAMRRRVGGGIHGAGDSRTRSHLVQMAQKENILLYEKVDEGVYERVQ